MSGFSKLASHYDRGPPRACLRRAPACGLAQAPLIGQLDDTPAGRMRALVAPASALLRKTSHRLNHNCRPLSSSVELAASCGRQLRKSRQRDSSQFGIFVFCSPFWLVLCLAGWLQRNIVAGYVVASACVLVPGPVGVIKLPTPSTAGRVPWERAFEREYKRGRSPIGAHRSRFAR